MPTDKVVVRCSGCKAKFKVPSARSEVPCPKCTRTINVAQAARSNPTKRKRPSSPLSHLQGEQNHSTTVEGSAPALGFYSYFTKHWECSHGHWFLPVFFTSLFAVPILSFLKPVIGFQGQLYAVAGLLGLSVTSFVVYSVQRTLGYYLGGARTIPEDTSSMLASFTYCGVVATVFPLGPIVAIEYVMPAKGLLANFVPLIEEPQSTIFTKFNLVEKEDSLDFVVTDEGVAGSGVDEGYSSETNPDLEAPSTPAEDDTDAVASNTTAPDDSPASTVQEDNETPVPTTRPTTIVAPASNLSTMVVIAEGTEATSDKALKDAFRNAVRQVVGAVVDADTIIENDEVISDKILTYSDGFISKYVVISESDQDGLFRKTIKATVERRSVVAKLKAANINAMKVNGGNLFAEAVTQLEADHDSTALLQKHLATLPSLLTAKVVSKPEYDRDSSHIVLKVAYEADQEAYDAFVRRFLPILDKISTRKVQISLKGRKAEEVTSGYKPVGSGWIYGQPVSLPENEKGRWLWVNTFHDDSGTSCRFQGYLLDCKSEDVLKPLLGKVRAHITLLDEDEAVVLEDNVLVRSRTKSDKFSGDCVFPQDRKDSISPSLSNLTPATLYQWRFAGHTGRERIPGRRPKPEAKYELVISPYFISSKVADRFIGYWTPSLIRTHRISATLAELKRVQEINCEIVFEP